jgi:hypothetical protein
VRCVGGQASLLEAVAVIICRCYPSCEVQLHWWWCGSSCSTLQEEDLSCVKGVVSWGSRGAVEKGLYQVGVRALEGKLIVTAQWLASGMLSHASNTFFLSKS